MITDGSEADAPAVPRGGELAKATTGTELTDVLDEAGGLFSAVDPNDLVTIVPETSRALVGAADTLARGIDARDPLTQGAHRPRAPLAPFLAGLGALPVTRRAVASRSAHRTHTSRHASQLRAEHTH